MVSRMEKGPITPVKRARIVQLNAEAATTPGCW